MAVPTSFVNKDASRGIDSLAGTFNSTTTTMLMQKTGGQDVLALFDFPLSLPAGAVRTGGVTFAATIALGSGWATR